MGFLTEKRQLLIKEFIDKNYIYPDKNFNIISTRQNKKGKKLKGKLSINGYHQISITINRKRFFILSHNIIWIFYNGLYKEGLTINHKDGIKINNDIDNLELLTARDNQLHAIKLGLQKPMCGEKNGCSKLTKKDVIFIRNNFKRINSKRSNIRYLSNMFNVDYNEIYKIVTNKRWRHI